MTYKTVDHRQRRDSAEHRPWRQSATTHPPPDRSAAAARRSRSGSSSHPPWLQQTVDRFSWRDSTEQCPWGNRRPRIRRRIVALAAAQGGGNRTRRWRTADRRSRAACRTEQCPWRQSATTHSPLDRTLAAAQGSPPMTMITLWHILIPVKAREPSPSGLTVAYKTCRSAGTCDKRVLGVQAPFGTCLPLG